MPPKLMKVSPQRLRELDLDERWLQARIDEDPSLLGLGDLQVLHKERRQAVGGCIDFLLQDPDEETRYEVEVMLGSLDESHIIRAIEYWDIERQRYPGYDHKAVIVAEEITARFFNVIRLLNRAVPLIAIQLSTFAVGDQVVLHFTKVLDIFEEAESKDDTGGERVDRVDWEKKSNPQSLAVLDKLVALLQQAAGTARPTYNKYHVALNAGGYNFAWLRPRKEAAHCHLTLWAAQEKRDEILGRLRKAGLPASPRRADELAIRLTAVELEEHRELLAQVLKEIAELAAH
jgi:hypothetical protein